jgi:hypothetical protein
MSYPDFNPIQIDLTVTKRNSNWVQNCPNCQNERIISYCQAWNIKKQNSKKECKSCALELGLIVINMTGLEKGRKFNGGTTGKKLPGKTKHMLYQALFNHLSYRPDIKEKFRQTKLGKRKENTNNWKGGKIPERNTAMARDDYKQWRKSIFQQDNYTCQICLIRGGNLEADHIKEWCNYPELRYNLDNGRTLCKDCHKQTDNYGHKAKRKAS